MKKPNITKGEWLSISAVQAGWDKTTYTVGVFEGDVLRTIATVFKQKDAKPISAVPEMIDALIATLNDTLDFGEVSIETEHKIKQALKKAGCTDE